MTKPEGRILLTHQLFHKKYIKESPEVVVVSDHMWLTDEKNFNKTTLFHRFISSLAYARRYEYHRCWVGDKGKSGPFTRACRFLKSKGVKNVRIFDPIDVPLRRSIQNICSRESMNVVFDDTPAFMETHADLDSFLKEKPPRKTKSIRKYSHNPFYKWQRARLGILVSKDGSPLGGRLTYDTENRKPFPKGLDKDPSTIVNPLPLPEGVSKEDLDTIRNLIYKKYKTNPGNLPENGLGSAGLYPMTNRQAMDRLQGFLKSMLPKFGPYEDAIHPNITYGYHSVLSSSLNNGLITPEEILNTMRKGVLKKQGELKGELLASVEGFIRQVFGWRSYTRMVYREERETMMRSNHLRHSRRLPKSWFRDSPITTKIPWLDSLFNESYDKAYSHHIIRLMVFSQWFLLMKIHPRDVLDWFWSVVSIDAYEWVMVPNVLGMGQFADGGMMMTRPYVSSSSYLDTMSRKTLKGSVIIGRKLIPWQDVWRALYYDFLIHHEKRLGKQYAYSSTYARIRKTSAAQIKEWKTTAKQYRRSVL